MPRLTFLALFLLLTAARAEGDMCLLPSAHAEGGAQALAWLAGDWVETRGEMTVREHWSRPIAGTLLGTGLTTKGATVRSYEFFRIATTAQGVSYFASPNAEPPTEFKAIVLCTDRVVFENKAHDFPKRIIYERGPGRTLKARVEDDTNREDFHYKAE